jgi:hypothetical protein
MKIHLTTFATLDYQAAQARLHATARECGIDAIDAWNLPRLRATSFYRENAGILEQRRGAGYWLWKPYILLETLRHVAPGDLVLYHDCGKGAGYRLVPFQPLVDLCLAQGGILPGVVLPDVGPNKKWTKRDCFVRMGCDTLPYWDQLQVSAAWGFYQNTPRAMDFVAQWLRWCRDPRVLTDQPNVCGLPNFPEFVDHRHDQSVLTNLTRMRGVAPLVTRGYLGHRIEDVLPVL